MDQLAPGEARLLTVYRLLGGDDRQALMQIAETMLGEFTVHAPRLVAIDRRRI